MKRNYIIQVTDENGSYHATEPNADHGVIGRGDSRAEAIRNLADAFVVREATDE